LKILHFFYDAEDFLSIIRDLVHKVSPFYVFQISPGSQNPVPKSQNPGPKSQNPGPESQNPGSESKNQDQNSHQKCWLVPELSPRRLVKPRIDPQNFRLRHFEGWYLWGSVFGRQNHVFSTFEHFSKVKSHVFLTSRRLSRFGSKLGPPTVRKCPFLCFFSSPQNTNMNLAH